MAGAEWCIMLYFAGPIGDCCIIFESKAKRKARGCASLLYTHGTLRRFVCCQGKLIKPKVSAILAEKWMCVSAE